jgi:acyl-CoA thioester hydrolase
MNPAHTLEMRVYYEDTDAAGIVYHSNYLKFAERGRTEMLRGLGFDHPRLAAEHGVVFALARCTVDFVRPARLDDLLEVRTEVVGVGGARIEMAQRVGRGSAVVARLGVTLAVLDARALRPTRLPQVLRRAFGAVEPGEIQSRGLNHPAIGRCP